MSKQIQEQKASNPLDTAKLLLAVAVLVGSIVGYYIYEEMHAVVRVLGVLAGVAISAFILYQTEIGRGWFHYLTHAKKEVRQVVWPTRQETTQMTLIVFVVVIIMGIFFWLVDMFFLWAVQLLTGQGG